MKMPRAYARGFFYVKISALLNFVRYQLSKRKQNFLIAGFTLRPSGLPPGFIVSCSYRQPFPIVLERAVD